MINEEGWRIRANPILILFSNVSIFTSAKQVKRANKKLRRRIKDVERRVDIASGVIRFPSAFLGPTWNSSPPSVFLFPFSPTLRTLQRREERNGNADISF